ncbi:Hypothetical protein R9X50_00543700 [Acrodontium crateriforme]|uniref:SGF29 C-terminal domain-containing protein n=1 Tax=Acrodontium crateriforme TaxID=150365 RepID=A0AAQ3M7T2_9PEZI|nr:Hypothetical protein R9X50_00543700 [Acrodontium crateriforme]
MSARGRGRANPNQDADEERRLWKEIKDKANEVDSMVARSNEIGSEIVELEAELQASLDKAPNISLDERLEKLYRENLKLTEEVQHIIEGKSNDMNLLDSLKILAGLREASEESVAAQVAQLAASQSQSRSSGGKFSRSTKKGGTNSKSTAGGVSLSTEEADAESAAPSPRVGVNGTAGRLSAKDKSSRAGSTPAASEAAVKIEDAESVASSADGANSTATGATGKWSSSGGAGGRGSNRLVLRLGEIVFCRHDPKNFDPKKGEPPEGEGILCRVTSVIGEGKQRRYEVQDADTSGEAPPPQRASVSQLIQIPESNKFALHSAGSGQGALLSDLTKGKQVMAQYPDTTTFYKAEVSETWRARDVVVGEKGEYVRLHFQDDESPREVERRFVLMEK